MVYRKRRLTSRREAGSVYDTAEELQGKASAFNSHILVLASLQVFAPA